MKRCAACGTENDDWRPFCTHCGASYAGAAAEPVLAPPPPGVAAPPPPPPPGTELSDAGRWRPGRPSTLVVAIAAVVAVAVAVGALASLTSSESKSHGSAGIPSTAPKATTTTVKPTPAPAKWDPRVLALTQFDSSQRDLSYKHPVAVVFLSPAAFKKRVTTDESKLTAKDRTDAENELQELRALGMVQGKVDLVAKLNQLTGSSILAYYDPDKKEVVIPGSKIDVEEKVTLAHELTHTLDDQYYNLNALQKIGDKHDTDAVQALIEGDARYVENKYIAKLSPADQQAYAKSQNNAVGPDDLNGVPKIFEILLSWPYDFGPEFIGVLDSLGGQARIDKAFESPPIDEEQVLDPVSYIDGDLPEPISAPVLPEGAKKIDSGKEFGQLMWYLMLSERIDAHIALEAALGWGADTYTDATENGRTCIEVHYRGETRADTDQMAAALDQWIAALPKGMASVKRYRDATLLLRSCDPGANAKVVTDRSVAAYGLLLFRAQLINEFVKQGATPAVATCVSDAVTAQATVAKINAGTPPAILSDVNGFKQLITTCKRTAGSIPSDKIDP